MILSCAGGLGFWLGIPPILACPPMTLRICVQLGIQEVPTGLRLTFHNKKSESRPSIHSLVGDLIGKEADGET